MKEKQADPIKTFRAQWAVMTFYERFEQVIALALSAIIAVIIVVTTIAPVSLSPTGASLISHPGTSRCSPALPDADG